MRLFPILSFLLLRRLPLLEWCHSAACCTRIIPRARMAMTANARRRSVKAAVHRVGGLWRMSVESEGVRVTLRRLSASTKAKMLSVSVESERRRPCSHVPSSAARKVLFGGQLLEQSAAAAPTVTVRNSAAPNGAPPPSRAVVSSPSKSNQLHVQ